MSTRRVTVVACGAPLAGRMADVCAALVAAGYTVNAVATADAGPWIDVAAVEDVTGAAVRTAHRQLGEGGRSPLPDAVVVCPATFNTVNKLASGIADTYALTRLNEWLGAGIPMVFVPMVNDRLWGHPTWSASLAFLEGLGVLLLDPSTGDEGAQPVPSGTGGRVVAGFDPAWLVTALVK